MRTGSRYKRAVIYKFNEGKAKLISYIHAAVCVWSPYFYLCKFKKRTSVCIGVFVRHKNAYTSLRFTK